MPSNNERGAFAVIFAMLLIPFLLAVGLAVDIGDQSRQRQKLWDTLDSAALAGASHLPDNGVAAEAAAMAFADDNFDKDITPTVQFWCYITGVATIDEAAAHIPATCSPGPEPYTTANYPGTSVTTSGVGIPCVPADGDTCNAITVTVEEQVDYTFAKVAGINSGSTGELTSAACVAGCAISAAIGGDTDIGLVIDRTTSMGPDALNKVRVASRDVLEALDENRHHVALGTLGPALLGAPLSCLTEPDPTTSDNVGTRVPVPLTNDYQTSPGTLDTNAPIVQSLSPTCWDERTGTNFGDPIKDMGAHLLSPAGRAGVQKGIIFMTDGEAYLPNDKPLDPCPYAENEAEKLKVAGVVIVTIAYGLEPDATCDGGEMATTVLANIASPLADGTPSLDDGGGAHPNDSCTHAADENADGDNFFCAPNSAAGLSDTFLAATTALTTALDEPSKLVRSPL